MKNAKTIAVLLVVLAVAASACSLNLTIPDTIRGNGVVTEESRPVENLTLLDVQGIGNVYVEVGDAPSLTIEAEENLLPYIEVENRGDRLVISVERNKNLLPTEAVNIYLTVTGLEGVIISGLGNVELPGLTAENFTIDLNGAGDIEIESLTAESLRANLSGLGDLQINAGEVVSQEIEISGSGKYNSPGLASQTANIEISGLGSAVVRVSDKLDVSISGAGDVEYYGDPEIDRSISGLGKLEQIGD
jgi:hypothetical protein